MVYTGLSALVGQSICLCPSICLSIIPYQLSVLYESVYTSPSIDRVSVCISISSVCYTSFGHSLFFRIHFHCSVLRSVPLLRVFRNSHCRHCRPLYRHFRLILSFRVLFFIFRRFLPSVCLSDSQSLSPYVHIYYIIYIRSSSRHLISQKIGTLRASVYFERTSGSHMRANEHRERTKRTKHTPKPTSGARSCTNVPHETLRANG